MVRPRIAPFSRPCSFEYVSAGSDQLFVGPASSFVGVQMKVNCSTRATSFGFERCKYERGTFLSFSLISTFCRSACSSRKLCSRSDPSHQKMFSGLVSSSTSCYPVEHRLIRRLGIADSNRRRNGGCDVFHEPTPKAFLSPGYFEVIDLAIGAKNNVGRFSRFSKKFFGGSSSPLSAFGRTRPVASSMLKLGGEAGLLASPRKDSGPIHLDNILRHAMYSV